MSVYFLFSHADSHQHDRPGGPVTGRAVVRIPSAHTIHETMTAETPSAVEEPLGRVYHYYLYTPPSVKWSQF